MATENQTLTLSLPAEFVKTLGDVAARQGKTAEELGATLLTASIQKESNANGGLPMDDRHAEDSASELAKLMRYAGSVDLGYPTGTTNEDIDADLAREYGDAHEEAR